MTTISRHTHIYMLIDTRPETIAKGWSEGFAFYCGKTVYPPEKRLAQHQCAANRETRRPVLKWIRACGRYLTIRVIETVPPGEDWEARERYWIAYLRKEMPVCTNVCNGGEGLDGCVPVRVKRPPPDPTDCAIMKRAARNELKRDDRAILAKRRTVRIQERLTKLSRHEKMLRAVKYIR